MIITNIRKSQQNPENKNYTAEELKETAALLIMVLIIGLFKNAVDKRLAARCIFGSRYSEILT